MMDIDVKLNTLSEEHLKLKQIQAQLFENMKILIESESHKVEKENTVIANQGLIIKNQEVIVRNQVNIINNQKTIVANQNTLTVIMHSQAKILNLVQKLTGFDENIEDTIMTLTKFNKELMANNKVNMLNNPNLI